MPASYFDVDGTLVRTNLVHPTLFYLANQQNPLRSLRMLARSALDAPRLLLNDRIDRRTFNEMLYAGYEGISEDRLMVLADEAFEKVLRASLYRKAAQLVARCIAEGHRIVLISGALDFLVRRLADHLKAHDVIANRLEIKDGHATGRLLRPVVAGPEKARLIRQHAQQGNFDLNECFAYSDSYSDVPMLSVVGHPCCVNPDFRLQHLARAYSWPIVDLT